MALLERMLPLPCSPQLVAEPDVSAGVVAGVTCQPLDGPAQHVTVQDFAESPELRAEWTSRIDAATPALEEKEDACSSGQSGTRKWGFGSVDCLVDDGVATVWWTDGRTQTLGTIEGTSDDIASVFEWWRQVARPLGRSESDETVPSGPEPSAKPEPTQQPAPSNQPFVRVPGPPRAITCDADADPIPDEWRRTWRIKNVELLERGGYERVVLNLVRTGRNRTNRPTQASIERVARSRVTRVVPNAPRPKRGGSALVIRLDGVRDGPDLRGYRPSNMDLASELSVVRDGDGRSVILSTPADTCYQMRIPVWGASASGKERRAEVYIDLTEG
jgi:hypothetical protein